jgi:hypothetical protein
MPDITTLEIQGIQGIAGPPGSAIPIPTNTFLANPTNATANPIAVNQSVARIMLAIENINNTSDLNKPISTAVQAALNLKANSSSLSAIALSGSASDLLSGTIPNARLSAQVARLDLANTFAGPVTIQPVTNVSQLSLLQDNANVGWDLHADSSNGHLRFLRGGTNYLSLTASSLLAPGTIEATGDISAANVNIAAAGLLNFGNGSQIERVVSNGQMKYSSQNSVHEFVGSITASATQRIVGGNLIIRSSAAGVGAQIYLGDSNFLGSYETSSPGIGAAQSSGESVTGSLAFYTYGGLPNARTEVARFRSDNANLIMQGGIEASGNISTAGNITATGTVVVNGSAASTYFQGPRILISGETGGLNFQVTGSSGRGIIQNYTTGNAIDINPNGGPVTFGGNITASGSLTSIHSSSLSDLSTLDLSTGQSRLHKNTTSGLLKLFVNDAGVIKSVTLT